MVYTSYYTAEALCLAAEVIRLAAEAICLTAVVIRLAVEAKRHFYNYNPTPTKVVLGCW